MSKFMLMGFAVLMAGIAVYSLANDGAGCALIAGLMAGYSVFTLSKAT